MKVQLSDTPIIIEKWQRFYEESTLIEEEGTREYGTHGTEPEELGRKKVMERSDRGKRNVKNEQNSQRTCR